MRKFKFIGIILALFFVMGIASCTHNIGVTPVDELTYMYSFYNAQHEDYMSMAANPNTTEAQKKIMRKKKPILDSLAILIPAFDKSLQGGSATPTQKQKIYDLLNSLAPKEE
jgi:hypothetical protein